MTCRARFRVGRASQVVFAGSVFVDLAKYVVLRAVRGVELTHHTCLFLLHRVHRFLSELCFKIAFAADSLHSCR